MKREEMEPLLDDIAAKLPVLDIVGRKQSYITGQELLLCGHKVWEGQVVEKNKMYNLWVPLAKGEIMHTLDEKFKIKETKVVYRELDHKKQLKIKWRINGLNGIYHYLRPYLSDEQMQWVKQKFMSVATA